MNSDSTARAPGNASAGVSDSVQKGSVHKPVLVPVSIVKAVLGLVEHLREASEEATDSAGEYILAEGGAGTVQVRAFRHGLSDTAEAWTGGLDWAALIIYHPAHDPEVYLVPGHHFTQHAFRVGGVLQHIDYIGTDEPGVYWTDLDGRAFDERFTRLGRYRIA